MRKLQIYLFRSTACLFIQCSALSQSWHSFPPSYTCIYPSFHSRSLPRRSGTFLSAEQSARISPPFISLLRCLFPMFRAYRAERPPSMCPIFDTKSAPLSIDLLSGRQMNYNYRKKAFTGASKTSLSQLRIRSVQIPCSWTRWGGGGLCLSRYKESKNEMLCPTERGRFCFALLKELPLNRS